MTVLVALLVGAAVLLAVLAALSGRRYGEWRRQGVPYVTPWPLVGNCFRVVFQRENVYHTIDRVCSAFPNAPFVGMYAGPSPVLLVRDPDAIKNITVKDFQVFTNHSLAPNKSTDPVFGKFVFCLSDGQWKSTRAQLSPAFSSGRLKLMHATVRHVSDQLVQCLRDDCGKGGGEVALNMLTTRFGVDVIGAVALGLVPGALKDPVNSPYLKAVAQTFDFGRREGFTTFLVMFAPGFYQFLKTYVTPLLPEWRMTVVRGLMQESTLHREKEPLANRDIFDILLGVRRKGEMSPDMFEAQVMALQVAGSETSAKTIMLALWELAKEPRCQVLLREELQAALAQEKAGHLSYEAIHTLPYLDQVFKETLRLWPLLPWLDRVAKENYVIPGAGLKVRKGDVIMIPVFSIQRDPNAFSEPDRFRPERFAPENCVGAEKTNYMPFGLGPRACIGSRFAEMNVKTAISEVILNFRVSLASSSPRTKEDLTISSTSFIISLEKELYLHFQPV